MWLKRLLTPAANAETALSEAAVELDAVACLDPEIDEVVAELRYQRLVVNHVGQRIRKSVGGEA